MVLTFPYQLIEQALPVILFSGPLFITFRAKEGPSRSQFGLLFTAGNLSKKLYLEFQDLVHPLLMLLELLHLLLMMAVLI